VSISTLTSKGQTTIPSKIRAYLGIHSGDKLEFLIDKDGRVIVTALTSDVTELKNLLPKPKRKISIEDMNQAITKRGGRT
jgi:antitoxin PrlF